MTFFVPQKPQVAPRTLDEFGVDFSEYAGAVLEDAKLDNPVNSIERSLDLHVDTYGKHEIVGDLEGMSFADDEADIKPVEVKFTPPSPALPEEVQKSMFAEKGLENVLKPHKDYTKETVEELITRKRNELTRQEIRDKASWAYAPAGFAINLGAQALDPINIATSFVPVIGEARLINMLGRSSGMLGRTGIRAGVGAAEGAVGAAMTEPFAYLARTQEQADYGMTDALFNVGLGAVFSGALRGAGGAVGDTVRVRNNEMHPWEIQAAKDLTKEQRIAFRDNLRQAHPDMTAEQAEAYSQFFDARARTWGKDLQQDPAKYYEKYAPEFRFEDGEGSFGDDVLFMAAKKSVYEKESNIEFIYDDTGVSFDLTDRERLKEYFGSLDAGRLKSLKHGNQDEYIRKLKEIADTIFPEGVEFKSKEGTDTPDHDYFLKEPRRARYAHSIGETITNENIRLVVSKADGEKIIFLKRYFDEEIGKDIWDVVVSFNNVLQTKFPTSGAQGKSNWIRTIEHERNSRKSGSEPEVPQSERPDGLTENTSNHQGSRERIIQDGSEGNLLKQSSLPNDASPRAAVNFKEDGKAIASFFKSADITSAGHEIYHIFRREFAETAASTDAPASVKRDWDSIAEYVGAEDGKPWTREMEEKFARAGESYLLEGKAPVSHLTGVFERLRSWFTNIYRAANESGVEISPTMRGVFDRMLDADSSSDAALSALVRGFQGNRQSQRLRDAFSSLKGSEQRDVFRAAVAQAAQGKRINVEPLVMRDAAGISRVLSDEDALLARTAQGVEQANTNIPRQLVDSQKLEADLQEAQALASDADIRLMESATILERSQPEVAARVLTESAAELAELDSHLARLDIEERVVHEAAACDGRR